MSRRNTGAATWSRGTVSGEVENRGEQDEQEEQKHSEEEKPALVVNMRKDQLVKG